MIINDLIRTFKMRIKIQSNLKMIMPSAAPLTPEGEPLRFTNIVREDPFALRRWWGHFYPAVIIIISVAFLFSSCTTPKLYSGMKKVKVTRDRIEAMVPALQSDPAKEINEELLGTSLNTDNFIPVPPVREWNKDIAGISSVYDHNFRESLEYKKDNHINTFQQPPADENAAKQKKAEHLEKVVPKKHNEISKLPNLLLHPTTGGRKLNTCALLSLIFGIAAGLPFVTFFFGVTAIALGEKGLNQIRDSGEAGRGLAIAGIIIGTISMVVWQIVLMYFLVLVLLML